MQRGKDLTVKNFREGKDDLTKATYTFQMSRHHWKSIEEEVRAWVVANWERWEEEKPKWLDEGMRNRIPVEYIPTVAARSEEKGRRASVVAEAEGGAGGTLRAIIRRASQGNTLGGDAKVVPTKEEDK